MRVMMFGWEFPPYNSGGLGTACFGLTRALSKTEVEVVFVLPKRADVYADSLVKIIFADQDKVTFKRVDSVLYPYLTSGDYLKLRQDKRLGGSFYGLTLLEEVLRYAELAKDIAQEEEFDIIHAHDWLSFPAGISAKRVSHKPLIVHVHATEFDRSGESINQAVYQIEKQGMEEANLVIAVSYFTKNMIIDRYGINPDKIVVVHNGIDSQDYPDYSHPTDPHSTLNNPTHPDYPNYLNHLSSALSDKLPLQALKQAGNKIVLFVGRVTFQKGPDYFIKAAKQVLEYNPHVYFVIAGSGDMEHQIMQQAASLGISDKVIFAGFLRGEELNSIYKAADLFVLPSVSEPFGIAPLESVVNGTPVLISKQSGVSEVLTHALRVDFWDIDEMTDKILSALNHPSLIQTLKTNSQQEVKKLTWLEAARKCQEIYRKLLNRA